MKNQANKPYFDALIVSCHIIVFFKVKYALIVHEMILKKLINGFKILHEKGICAHHFLLTNNSNLYHSII